MSSLKGKIAKNLAVSVAGRFVSGALGVAAIAFTTRALGPESFGEYNLVLTIAYICSVLGSFGLDPLLAREIAHEGVDEKKIVARIFFVRTALLLFFLSAGAALVFFLPYSFSIKLGVVIAAAGALFFSLAQLLNGVFQKYLRTAVPALAEVAIRTVQFFLSFLLYKNGAGIFSFLFVFVAGGALNLAIVYRWVAARIDFHFRPRLLYQEARAHFISVAREGWPLAASAVLTLIYFRGDTIMLSLMHSSREVGVYGAAYKVLENAIFIPIAFAGLVLPLLSRSFFADPTRFRAVFQKAFDFCAVCAVPFAAGGAYLSADIAYILGGVGFEQSAAPLRVLFLAIAFIFFGALLGGTLVAMRKQKDALWAYGAAAALNIMANLYFIRRYSYMGAAWVTAATEALVTLYMLFIVSRSAGFFPSMRVLAKALGASGAMLLVLYFSPVQHFAALLFSGALVYAGLIYTFKGVSKDDLFLLLKLK